MKKLSRKHRNTLLVIAFSLLFLVASLSPLVRSEEIRTRMMVNAIGIDATDEGVLVTAETISEGSNEIVSGKGRVLSEALQNLNERYGRNAELGHCGLIALGEGLEREDIVGIFLSILSSAKVNSGCSVISTEGNAHDFMANAALLTQSMGEGITGFVTFADSQASVTIPSALEVMQQLKSKSGATALPVIGLRDKPEEKGQSGSSSPGDSGSGGSSQQSDTKETEIQPPRIARVVGSEVYELDENTTKGLIWMTPRSTGGMMEAPYELDGNTYKLHAILREKDAGLDVEFAEKPIVTLKVDAQLKLSDRFAMLAELETGRTVDEVFDGMNAAYEKRITEELKLVAEASKKDDFLGYKTWLYRKYPRQFKDWSGNPDDIELKFDIKAKVF